MFDPLYLFSESKTEKTSKNHSEIEIEFENLNLMKIL